MSDDVEVLPLTVSGMKSSVQTRKTFRLIINFLNILKTLDLAIKKLFFIPIVGQRFFNQIINLNLQI